MSSLKELIPYLDDIMTTFYVEMLSHEQLSVFFKDKDSVNELIDKQKNNFIDSLDDNPSQLESRFRKLGSFHYDIKVPSVDFLKSTSIWKSAFNKYALTKIKNPELIFHIEDYFYQVDNHMSRGYLERQLEADVNDLEMLIEQYSSEVVSNNDTLEHLNWLKDILFALQKNDASLAPELNSENCKIHKILTDPPEIMRSFFKDGHFIELHERLHIEARSLFYFVTKGNYPEVLALYANLLSVYKITLLTLGSLSLQETIKTLRFDLQIENERKEIYSAAMHGTHHIVNNLLNQLHLVKFEIKKHSSFDPKVVSMFDDMKLEASALLEKLSSIEKVDKETIKASVLPV